MPPALLSHTSGPDDAFCLPGCTPDMPLPTAVQFIKEEARPASAQCDLLRRPQGKP